MDNETLLVIHNRDANRFEMAIEDQQAVVNYRMVGEDTYNLYYAGVPPEFEGRGYGGRLVQGALEQIKAEGKRFIPTCPFIAVYVRRHPNYKKFMARENL
jgi:predicted GNAT family acetyltransferase